MLHVYEDHHFLPVDEDHQFLPVDEDHRFLPVDKNHLKTCVDEIGHQGAVVSAHGLDALAVHLVMNLWTREVEASVALLVDQQIRVIHLETGRVS